MLTGNPKGNPVHCSLETVYLYSRKCPRFQICPCPIYAIHNIGNNTGNINIIILNIGR